MSGLRQAFRLLTRSPVMAGAVVLSIGIGTGANVAIFSVINAILLRPPVGVAEPERLVALYEADDQGWELHDFSHPEYVALREGGDAFAELTAIAHAQAWLSAPGQAEPPEPVQVALVSANYFEALGVRPVLGRVFRPEEDAVPDRDAVAVLSHGLWRRRYGADPAIVGRQVLLNGHNFEVIGVAPAGFSGTVVDAAPDVWMPTMTQSWIMRPPRIWSARAGTHDLINQRGYGWLTLVGRLRPGLKLEAAAARLQSQRVLSREEGVLRDGRTVKLLPLMQARLSRPLRALVPRLLVLLMVSSSLLLVLAAANVANLLLHRLVARRQEMAVRLALGASPFRLIRQLLTESVLLALLGGGLGLVLAGWTRRSILAAAPSVSPTLSLDLGIDSPVLAFAVLLSLATGALCGLWPAWQASRVDVLGALKKEGVLRSGRLSRVLVGAQISLCVLLLVWTGLLVRSLQTLLRLDPGFRTDVLLTALDLEFSHPRDELGQRFYRDLRERIEAVPGVTSATFLRWTPLRRTVYQPGGQPRTVQIDYEVVGLHYFETMGIRLREGRSFDASDQVGSPAVVIVNEALARLAWPGENPLGKRDGNQEVVGVAADARLSGLGVPPAPMTYLPLLQHYEPKMTLAVRGTMGRQALEKAVRKAVQDLDPRVSILSVSTVADQRDRSLWPTRFAGGLLSLFGLIALVLATVGAYGVASYAMAQRTRELGIRMAIGAARRDLWELVTRQEGSSVAAGLLAGAAAAAVLGRLPSFFLHGVGPTSAGMIAAITLMVAIPVVVAIALAARRALALDPANVLRHE